MGALDTADETIEAVAMAGSNNKSNSNSSGTASAKASDSEPVAKKLRFSDHDLKITV